MHEQAASLEQLRPPRGAQRSRYMEKTTERAKLEALRSMGSASLGRAAAPVVADPAAQTAEGAPREDGQDGQAKDDKKSAAKRESQVGAVAGAPAAGSDVGGADQMDQLQSHSNAEPIHISTSMLIEEAVSRLAVSKAEEKCGLFGLAFPFRKPKRREKPLARSTLGRSIAAAKASAEQEAAQGDSPRVV